MAAYVCPQLTDTTAQQEMMSGMPCAGMDKEKPVHCAQYQSGAQLALEHLAETRLIFERSDCVFDLPRVVSPSAYCRGRRSSQPTGVLWFQISNRD